MTGFVKVYQDIKMLESVYLKIVDFLANSNRKGEELIKATDQRETYRLQNKLMTQGVHPLGKILRFSRRQ